MGAADETLRAVNEVHGREKPDDMGVGEWIWGALQGDFNPERTPGQIGFDMVVSLIPIVDTICDLRDLVANIRNYQLNPKDKITLFFIVTTIIGFFPELGTVVKSALRLVWVYLKPLIKHADDIMIDKLLIGATNRACDMALPRITEYLQHSQVVKWATRKRLPDMYKFISETVLEVEQKIDPAAVKKLLNQKFDELKSLLKKNRGIVPKSTQRRIDELATSIDAVRGVIGNAVDPFVRPGKIVLRVLAKRLDDQAWRVETYRTNRGWIAPISESGSAKLINAQPPAWAKPFQGELKFPRIPRNDKLLREMLNDFPDHPKISSGILSTFSRNGGVRPDVIVGPAKLYRVVDPSNEGAGIFWVSEAEFKNIKNRDDWRSKFAIKPEWNQNGWAVEYEVKAGESLPVWRGPAASQELGGTQHYLEGGGEQIVFYPGNRDEMVEALPRIDRVTGEDLLDSSGNVDRRVEFTDLTREVVPLRLRSRIVEPHIKGPFEQDGGLQTTPEMKQKGFC